MNNIYSILWFDDNARSQKAFERRLKKQLKKLGFGLSVDFHQSADVGLIGTLCEQMRVYNQYDLIMFDHKLEGGKNGARFAAEFRRHKIYTDMVYYSSSDSDTLWSALRREKVDGVYILNRDGMDNELIGIVAEQISRVFDIGNMRGFILQLMSQIEGAIRLFLVSKFSEFEKEETAEGAAKILSIIATEEKSIANKNIRRMEKLTPEECKDFIKDGRISFDRVRSVLAKIGGEDKNLFGEESLLLTLQRIRNMFAHRRHNISAVTHRLYLDGDKTHPEGYSAADFKELRIMLMKLTEELKPVIGTI